MRLEFTYGEPATAIQQTKDALILNLSSKTLGRNNAWQALDDITIDTLAKDRATFTTNNGKGGILFAPPVPILARELYTQIFAHAKGSNLLRCWNYLPNIGQGDNYPRFNEARANAFYEAFEHPKPLMSASTGIDIHTGQLVIAYLAANNQVQHLENPRQTPAYDYPAKHGKRPPSFARASVATIDGKRTIYVSGTASIRGSETVGDGDLEIQTEVTLENIAAMLKQAGYRKDLYQTQAIVYLRNPGSHEQVKALLEQEPLYKEAIYLQANICRKDLDIEIELAAYGN